MLECGPPIEAELTCAAANASDAEDFDAFAFFCVELDVALVLMVRM